MSNPILVVQPGLVVVSKPVDEKVKIGDLVVDRKSTAKNWRKRIAVITQISSTYGVARWYDVRTLENHMMWAVSTWRWVPIQKYKADLDKLIAKQHKILTRQYKDRTGIDEAEVKAREQLGV